MFNPGGSTTQQSPDDDSPVESVAVGEMSDQELEININKLLDTIEKIAPPTPLSQTNSVNITSQSKLKKKAHCKQCGHLMQGHKTQRSTHKMSYMSFRCLSTRWQKNCVSLFRS